MSVWPLIGGLLLIGAAAVGGVVMIVAAGVGLPSPPMSAVALVTFAAMALLGAMIGTLAVRLLPVPGTGVAQWRRYRG